MKTKTNKIPLVGPRGRQEILKKVEQIAQHNYTIVRLAEFGFPDTTMDDIVSMTESLFNKLQDNFEKGILFDTLLQDYAGSTTRILKYKVDQDGLLTTVAIVGDEDIKYLVPAE